MDQFPSKKLRISLGNESVTDVSDSLCYAITRMDKWSSASLNFTFSCKKKSKEQLSLFHLKLLEWYIK